MSYFKLDVTRVNDSIQKYKKNKMNYEEDLMLLCNSLTNIDSSWNDANSQVFVKKVISDKHKLVDYLQSMDMLFSELANFINGLELSLFKLGYRDRLKYIKFDDSQISYIKKYLNNVLYYLNDAIYQINNYFRSSNFRNMNLIYTLKSQLRDSVSLVKTIIDNIDDFVSAILNEVNDSINRINKINDLDLKLNVVRYNYNIVDLH